ncbi:hypothetical protein BDQ12DRAFT_685050 [Crucibulum laeve]|uniref:RRM domain-containing protein n=1 Tax=Crucibulum laeve TaxID=68775 RepID=A0A5C3LZW4_9AGAR|nr:hypothetical protein BDQ12DRAFT_685050 [Crucibulum laeve]
MFIGGLSWETTDEGLRDYFSQFGKVDACTIMRDPSGTSRGFAFMTFEDPNAVNAVVAREHVLDGKSIDPKRAIPREEHLKNTRYFVGGLSSSTTSESMRDFFSVYGKVVDATVMVDRDSGRSKGFGFVTFEDSASSDQFVGKIGLVLDDKEIEVKMAQARSQREQTRISTSSNIGIRDMHEREPRASSTSSVFSSTPSPMATPYQSSISQMPMTGVSMPMLSMNPMMLAMGMGMNGYNGIGVMNPMTMMGGGINMGSMGNMATARMGMVPMGASNMGGMMSGMPASGTGYRGLPVNGMSGLVNGNLPRTFMNAGPGPMRLTSRGQHNFHPYTR